MLLRAQDILGRSVKASDGEIGRIRDIYFDDQGWNVRYLVIKLGNFLSQKDVLIIPSCFKIPEPDRSIIETDLSTRGVSESPHADSDMPVSRQYEVLLHSYYGWEPYWYYPNLAGFGSLIHAALPATQPSISPEDLVRYQNEIRENSDPHLRSFNEVKGYQLKATDDQFGHLEDVFIDQETARITHLVIDTINWWPSQNVLLDVTAVKDIILSDKCIVTSMTKQQIKDAPPYKGQWPVTDGYQKGLEAYYQSL